MNGYQECIFGYLAVVTEVYLSIMVEQQDFYTEEWFCEPEVFYVSLQCDHGGIRLIGKEETINVLLHESKNEGHPFFQEGPCCCHCNMTPVTVM